MPPRFIRKGLVPKWVKYSLVIGSCGAIVGGALVSNKRIKKAVAFDFNQQTNDPCPTYVEISLLKLLPLRITSRIWGTLNNLQLPSKFREPIYTTFCNTYNCDLSEAETSNLLEFRNLQEFFTRSLRSELRPIAKELLTSPCDGTILNFGPVVEEKVDQVKGATYSLSAYFGPNLPTNKSDVNSKEEENFPHKLLHNPTDNCLYQCVIYLAPGDYHKFHSPVDWHVNFRRHFSGKLFFVKPTFANWLNNLFTLNERALYLGEWCHGFFSLCAIAAANVGSIKIYCDHTLATNRMLNRKYVYKDRKFDDDIVPAKGEPFGQFNLGSTIVLIFEAPKDFQFNINLGQKIKFGQSLVK